MIAATPAPPYYAVIFTSLRSDETADETADANANEKADANADVIADPDAGGDAGVNADHVSYEAMSQRMMTLAALQPGFLGVESAREDVGITVSYWASLESIRAWKQQVAHLAAQRRGRSDWYRAYRTRICLVERDYGFDAQ